MDLQQAMAELCDQVADKVVERLRKGPESEGQECERHLDPRGAMAQAVEASVLASGVGADELEDALRALQAKADEVEAERAGAVAELATVRDALKALREDAVVLVKTVDGVVCPMFSEQQKVAPGYLLPMPTLQGLRKLHQVSDALRNRIALS
jgi:hypothetical protein